MGLKEKAVNSVLWSVVERFSVMGINFVMSIIIARLVEPTDFGAIAMLTIFLGISNVFIDSGFANALIRKTDRTNIDNSTVFYFNIGVGIGIYLLLFVTAPLIASFYKMPILKDILRVIALVILFNSLSIVQQAILTANLNFKSQAKISVISVLLSGTIGVVTAYWGYGVWALAIQMVIAAFIRMILLWIYAGWLPIKAFSIQSFRSLFGYGSKLLIANLVVTINSSISSLILGKKFAASQLGYYNRGEQFVNFPLNSITAVFQKVTFPVFNLKKDDVPLLREYYLKTVCVTAILVTPIMAILFVLSRDVIILFLTEKWLPSTIMIQILIFSFGWSPIFSINMNILSVLGYSKYILNIELVKIVLRITAILIAIPFGIEAVCYALVIIAFINTFFYTHYTNKVIQVGWIKQMLHIIPYIVISAFVGSGVHFVIYTFDSILWRIIIGVILFLVCYMLILCFFDRDNWKFMLSLLSRKKSGIS